MKYAVRKGNGWLLFPSDPFTITWKPISAAEFDTVREATQMAVRADGSVVDHPMSIKYCVVVEDPRMAGRWQYVTAVAGTTPIGLSFEIYQAWQTQLLVLAHDVAETAAEVYPDCTTRVVTSV